jgi:DNA-directed RNA polymerase subunit H (RpoH/RPB5)
MTPLPLSLSLTLVYETMARVVTEWVTGQALKVLTEMLADRGYGSVDVLGGHRTFLRGGILMRCEECDVVCMPEKIGVKELRALEENYDPESAVIVVTLEKPTPPGIKKMGAMAAWCTVLEMSFLVRNVSRHCWVPKHEVMKEDEVRELCQMYRLQDLKQLPRILQTDPQAIYCGAKIGDVLRIRGKEGTHVGGGVQYRIVTGIKPLIDK